MVQFSFSSDFSEETLITHLKSSHVFRKCPPKCLLEEIFSCCCIPSLETPWSMLKEEIFRHSSVEDKKRIIEGLRPYFFPCKAKVFLEVQECDEDKVNRKFYTVLRQLLYLFGKKIAYRRVMKNRSTQKRITIMDIE